MQIHGIRGGDVKIGHFVFPNHASGIDKGIFIAEIVRSKACFFLWVGESELYRFL